MRNRTGYSYMGRKSWVWDKQNEQGNDYNVLNILMSPGSIIICIFILCFRYWKPVICRGTKP